MSLLSDKTFRLYFNFFIICILVNLVSRWANVLFSNIGIFGLALSLLLASGNKFCLRILILPAILTIIFGAIYATYGPISLGMYAAFAETNITEVLGFSSTFSWVVILQTLAFVIAFVCYYRLSTPVIQGNTMPDGSNAKPLKIILFLVFLGCVYISFPIQALKNFVSTGFEYHKVVKELLEESKKPNTWEVTKNEYYQKYKNYVLVIGESARADYFSVFGYDHETTPFLNQAKGIFFTKAYSPSYGTVLSLSRTLQLPLKDGIDFDVKNNIMNLANKGGYETIWITNQGKLGTHDTSSSFIASSAKHLEYLHTGSYQSFNVDDDELLVRLEKYLKEPVEGSRVIVLHTFGSHVDPCHRLHGFENNFTVFKKKEANCYLATIRKTDEFLRKLQERISKEGSYSIIYFSDHGIEVNDERVGPSSMYISSYHVPFLILNSDSREHEIYDKYYSNLHFMSLYAQWLGLNTNHTDKAFNPHHVQTMKEVSPLLIYYEGENEDGNYKRMVSPLLLPEDKNLESTSEKK
ncbi:phosphoethanolamine transferase [Basilea psittacipulmonis]|nr:phosphoethanolamine transferase [Basilea psittacipulmonis]